MYNDNTVKCQLQLNKPSQLSGLEHSAFNRDVIGSNPIGGIFPNKGGNFHVNYIKIIDDVIIWNVIPPNKVMDVPL